MRCYIKSLQNGKYQIESLLGSGGFANTYLATQSGLEKKVAIKEFFMKEYCDRNESTSQVLVPTEGSKQIVDRYKQKFLKEAQMIASLKNDHIIKIYDIFEENDTAYYVMEYVSLGSLKDKVENSGALSDEQAVRYIRQVGNALEYLHSQNILHLDIKPANILVGKEDIAILIDFGISKHYDSEGGQTSTTPTGISKGYAPIEQYQQGSIANFSPATDIYSLGATLFYLVTGQTPPEASVVYEDGLPSIINGYSEAIRNVVTTAMSPRRKDRFQSVESFLRGLPEVSEADYPMSQGSVIDKSAETDEETTLIGDTYNKPELDNQQDKDELAKAKESSLEDADKIEGWMAFFLWAGIGLGVLISVLQSFFSNSILSSLLYVSVFALVGFKAIRAFYKRSENAVPLAITYCIMIGMDACFLAILNLITNDAGLWGQVLRGAIWSGVWVTYLCCSDSVKCRFPEETRKWHRFEKITLWILGILYIAVLIITYAANSSEASDAGKATPKSTSTKVDSQKGSKSTTGTTTKKSSSTQTPTQSVDTDATKLKSAIQQNDYTTVKNLADKGYAPAYVPLAKHYLKSPTTHDLADKYAKKAKTAGIKEAQNIIDDLDALGFYD